MTYSMNVCGSGMNESVVADTKSSSLTKNDLFWERCAMLFVASQPCTAHSTAHGHIWYHGCVVETGQKRYGKYKLGLNGDGSLFEHKAHWHQVFVRHFAPMQSSSAQL